jgi:multiple sugar transport system permease protein
MELKTRQSLTAYGFLSPTFLLFGIFLLFPVLLGFLLAFKEITVLNIRTTGDLVHFVFHDYVGLRNFSDALTNPVFYTAFKNTLIYTAVMVPFSVFGALFLAALIQPLNEKAQIFFRSAYYLPSITSAVVISMIWRWVLEPDKGLLNLALGLVGIEGPNWLGDPNFALGSVILAGSLYAPGFGVLVYTVALRRIPIEVKDSGRIDGAKLFERWFYIYMPLLKPTTLYLMVINTILSFQTFTQVYILTRGGPGDSTMTLLYHIYDLAFVQAGRKGEAAAVALVLFVLVAVLASIEFRLMRSEVQY